MDYIGILKLVEEKKFGYHRKKMDLLNTKGIRLLSIFSDEWLDKQEISKEKIKHTLGLSEKSIFGRKTKVTPIDRNIAVDFLNKYHLQGAPTKLLHSYGIFFLEELIGVMSFNVVELNYWRLSRFAMKKHVIGGASKLLSAFIKDSNPDKIDSFADLRWSVGNVYEKLGFVVDRYVPVMQSYVEKYTIRHHKLKFS